MTRKRIETTGVEAVLGARIRAARQTNGLSQTALAERLGVSFQQVQKYEKGANRFSVAKILEISNALLMDPEVLLAGAQEAAERVEGPLLSTPGAVELLAIYASLTPAFRKAVFRLARDLATTQQNDTNTAKG